MTPRCRGGASPVCGSAVPSRWWWLRAPCVSSGRASLRQGHPGRDRRRAGPDRSLRRIHGAAVEHRRTPRPLFPGVREPPLPPHRPLGRAGGPHAARRAGGDEPFILHPGEFVLASTYEVISLPDDLASRLEGKSSLGRLGLVTHSTAGFIDPGFSGHVTLELSNLATLPIKLWPGMKIGQLCMFRLSSPYRVPLRQRPLRVALPGPARADGLPVLPELPPDPGLRR